MHAAGGEGFRIGRQAEPAGGLQHPKVAREQDVGIAKGAQAEALLRNDLEAVTSGRHPEIAAIKARLLAAGAIGALMSGSGPTVFGVFAAQAEAERAAVLLADGTGWWAAAVTPV